MIAKELIWAGGEHGFRLGIGELRALQQKCDAGPAFIRTRLQLGHWYVDDVIEPIRLGLIGGGMASDEARKLVGKHVETEALNQHVPLAVVILSLVLDGDEDDRVGEPAAGTETTIPTRSRTENGGSPGSTPPAP